MVVEWEDYTPDVYVERSNILSALDRVLDPDSHKHLGVLSGPPGVGKTWLTRRLEKIWREEGQLAFWLSVPSICSHENGKTIYDEKKAYAWLSAIFQQVGALGISLQPMMESDRHVASYIDELVQIICHTVDERLRRRPPMLLVDGYDEVSVEQALVVGRSILDHFLSVKCTRVIMGIRDLFVRRTLIMRQSEEHFALKDGLSTYDQFVLFKRKYYPDVTDLDETNLNKLKSVVVEYEWDHPYINAFLFDRALKASQLSSREWLLQKDLRECCESLINRWRPALISDDSFNLLKMIAKQLGPTWTARDLRSIGVNEDELEELFKLGVIYNQDNGRRQVSYGLRPLLRNLID
jgi:hypothetical protein